MPATWRDKINLTASLDAAQNATLAPASSGLVTKILVHSGQSVPAGALLVQLQDATQLAQLELDQAKLTQLQKDLLRAQKLRAINGISDSTLEGAKTNLAEAQAQIDLDQAAIQNLSVTAPFAGTLGIIKIAPGDFLTAGQAITTLTGAGGAKLYFAIPQSEAAGIAPGQIFALTVPYGAQNIAVTGTITALSPALNPMTNAQDAEGSIPAATKILPGMTGVVSLATGAPQPAFLVPTTALNDSTLGPYVFVLTPAGNAYTLTPVYVSEYGDAGPNTYVSTAGLQAGQKIVALGGFKLTAGASVSIASP
jgi:RND family efflux transporter MFP subunit